MIGENKSNTFCDPTHHAEIGLIRKYCSEHHVFDPGEYTLYTSCELYVMCSGAMVWSNLGRLVYSVSHDQLAEIAGGNIMIACEEVLEKSPQKPEVTGELVGAEGLEVFEGYQFHT